MEELCRGLDDNEIKEFSKSEWFDFYENYKDKDELFLAFRKNYINIYYKGEPIVLLETKDNFKTAIISKNYLDTNENRLDFDKFQGKYETIKTYIDNMNDKEREVQQDLIYRNNLNRKSNWVCVDMEYQHRRKNAQDGKKSGEFDIIAVSTGEKHRIAIIELKVGSGAFSSSSGLSSHAKEWKYFLENNRYEQLLDGVVKIIKNNNFLYDDYPIKNYEKVSYEKKPEFYYLICSGNENMEYIKNNFCQYLWEENNARRYNVKGNIASKNNIEKVVGYDITEKGAGNLYCNVLFTTGEGKEINDILEDRNYDRTYIERLKREVL